MPVFFEKYDNKGHIENQRGCEDLYQVYMEDTTSEVALKDLTLKESDVTKSTKNGKSSLG